MAVTDLSRSRPEPVGRNAKNRDMGPRHHRRRFRPSGDRASIWRGRRSAHGRTFADPETIWTGKTPKDLRVPPARQSRRLKPARHEKSHDRPKCQRRHQNGDHADMKRRSPFPDILAHDAPRTRHRWAWRCVGVPPSPAKVRALRAQTPSHAIMEQRPSRRNNSFATALTF